MPNAAVDQLLHDLDGDDRGTLDRLVAAVYPELQVIARALLRNQRSEHPFETTDLVHEAYLKLVRYQDVHWHGRDHFFGAITQTMRRLLIDHARAAATLKRNGTHVQLTQEVVNTQEDASLDPFNEWIDLLDCLARVHPRWAKIVECRCVQGLTIQETADALNISHCTVSTDWQKTRTWLGQELGGLHETARNGPSSLSPPSIP